MEVRAAKNEEEVDQAYELAANIFGSNYDESRKSLSRARELEPLASLEDAVVVVEGESVLGFVRILNRRFQTPIGLIQAGGITSVCTHPDLRGQGLGIKVMDAAIQRSRQRGDVFSILFARRAVDGWYPKLGYVGLGCHVELSLQNHLPSHSIQQSSEWLVPGVDCAYISAYADAYLDSYNDVFLSFHRNREWWTNLERRLTNKALGGSFITLVLKDQAIGYFILSDDRVIEAAALPQYRSYLLSGLLRYYEAEYGSSPILKLPLGHWCMREYRRWNHSLTIRHSFDGGHMVRILDSCQFKNIVASVAVPGNNTLIEEVFQSFDVSKHDEANRLLLSLAGASRKGGTLSSTPTAQLIPELPSWSLVDEL